MNLKSVNNSLKNHCKSLPSLTFDNNYQEPIKTLKFSLKSESHCGILYKVINWQRCGNVTKSFNFLESFGTPCRRGNCRKVSLSRDQLENHKSKRHPASRPPGRAANQRASDFFIFPFLQKFIHSSKTLKKQAMFVFFYCVVFAFSPLKQGLNFK